MTLLLALALLAQAAGTIRGVILDTSTSRNALRVPAYARIDVRANRTFTWEQRRLTLFVEAINVANRDNARFALPSVNRQTLVATGRYDTMMPLLPSLGILLEF